MADDPLLDPDEFYLRYLETCAMNGVEPVSPERARELLAQWGDAVNAAAKVAVDQAIGEIAARTSLH